MYPEKSAKILKRHWIEGAKLALFPTAFIILFFIGVRWYANCKAIEALAFLQNMTIIELAIGTGSVMFIFWAFIFADVARRREYRIAEAEERTARKQKFHEEFGHLL